MRVAAAAPEPERLRPRRGSYLSVGGSLLLLLLVITISAFFHDSLELMPVVLMLLPSALIDTRYRYLRAFRPNAVPTPLFDADPGHYERLLWWRSAVGALTVGVVLGGFTMGPYTNTMPRISPFAILMQLTFTTWLTLHVYIKVRNGLRTS